MSVYGWPVHTTLCPRSGICTVQFMLSPPSLRRQCLVSIFWLVIRSGLQILPWLYRPPGGPSCNSHQNAGRDGTEGALSFRPLQEVTVLPVGSLKHVMRSLLKTKGFPYYLVCLTDLRVGGLRFNLERPGSTSGALVEAKTTPVFNDPQQKDDLRGQVTQKHRAGFAWDVNAKASTFRSQTSWLVRAWVEELVSLICFVKVISIFCIQDVIVQYGKEAEWVGLW